jgi:hypothetical protein
VGIYHLPKNLSILLYWAAINELDYCHMTFFSRNNLGQACNIRGRKSELLPSAICRSHLTRDQMVAPRSGTDPQADKFQKLRALERDPAIGAFSADQRT